MREPRQPDSPHPPASAERPAGWEVQPEGEPTAGRSSAWADAHPKRQGLLAPSRADGEAYPPCSASCPLVGQAAQIAGLAGDLAGAIRRLRAALDASRACPLGKDCHFRRYFQAEVDAAITQVAGEWGMP